MTARLIVLSLILASASLPAEEDAFNPFSSIVKRGNTIVATLSAGRRWVVAEGGGATRDALDGESFHLTDGDWMFLSEPHPTHVIYRLRCHLSPPSVGVQVEQRFEGGTFRDMSVKKRYFLNAQ
jgi:hypothetical protein